jgi:hypothetical protein
MPRFLARAVVVDAIQFTGRDSCDDVFAFLGVNHEDDGHVSHDEIDISDDAVATVGDWIVRDSDGRFSVWKPDVFAEAFEPLETA